MNFRDFIASGSRAVSEGAVYERLMRDPDIVVDPHIFHASLIYDDRARPVLEAIHRGYLEAARRGNFPAIIFTDTWRATRQRIDQSAFADRPVNEDNARFLTGLRHRQPPGGPPVFIAGQIGPCGDAYKPQEALSREAARDFHRPQLEALVRGGCDYLHASTIPALSEAMGIADAMADTGQAFIISFVIRRTGTLLDGTPLAEAIERMDEDSRMPAVGYSVNCVHPEIFASAAEVLERSAPELMARIVNFQANTSALEVEELDGSMELHTQAPEAFAEAMMDVHRRFGIAILGGCCGTDDRHLNHMSAQFSCL